MKISGRLFYLRTLINEDLNEEYLSWLKDLEVNQFLEVRFSPPNKKQAQENLTKYNNKTNFFFGIFDTKNNKFVGTITLKVNHLKKNGYFGYMIGDKNYWGTHAGIDSIALLMDFAFSNLSLQHIWGGTIIYNIGSIFNFKKLGFTLEKRVKDKNKFKGKPTDALIFRIFEKEWFEQRKKFNYKELK